MKQIAFYILLLSFSFGGFAQTYRANNIRTKAIERYEAAILFLKDGAVKEAIPILNTCIAIDSNYVDAYLSLAGAYGELKNYNQAIKLYEKARLKDTAYFKVYNLPYSINLAGVGNFNAALQAVNLFLTIPNISERSTKSAEYRKKSYEFAIIYQNNHTSNYVFNPTNLGDSINSEFSEYFPSLSVDDSLLVFTRRGAGQIKGEYFFQSKISNNTYSKAAFIKGDMNQEPLKGAITVSADGEWMIFAGQLPGKNYGSYDLYISYNTPKGWSEPENLGDNINTEYWESAPSLSPDNKTLYFSSNRPDGFGGSDIYYSTRSSNGKWGMPANMGGKVNTAGDEQAPYIHADNQTLYFSSNGLPGYGGSDLFIMRKNAAGLWQDPQNLGYPINTIENEGSMAVSADGLTAYYASDRSDSRGGLDLYKFILRDDIRPFRTLYVKGQVFDGQTHKGIPSTIELTNNNTQQVLMQIQADELGKYYITLPLGSNYTFTVNRKGYLFYSKQYLLHDKLPDSTYVQDIALQPFALNAKVILKNIHFEPNSFQLTQSSTIELDKLWQLLSENASLKVQINGHTDDVGKAESNLLLSTNRAKAVVAYLINKGISAQRLLYKGFGALAPIADNATEAGREQNRRTEFVIIGL